jgi:hypothetical protein
MKWFQFAILAKFNSVVARQERQANILGVILFPTGRVYSSQAKSRLGALSV